MKLSANFTRLMAAVLCLSILSCKKDVMPIDRESTIYPRTDQEKEKAALHTEFATMLRLVYQDTEAFREVQAAIWSGYYEDERVLLQALLAPGSSPLYAVDAFKRFKTGKGLFQKQFDRFINNGKFPLLQRHLQKAGYRIGSNWPSQEKAPLHGNAINAFDPSNEKRSLQVNAINAFNPDHGSDEEPLAIYFPYSENYKPTLQDEKKAWMPATLVAADRNADQAPGQEPLACQGNDCYKPVTVNDDYCEKQVVHIAQSGGVKAILRPAVTPPATGIHMVMLGSVMCKNQYDNLVSFTGNGGGSELRFIRADGYLEQNSNGQITSPQNVIAVNCSRKDIRKKRWISVNGIWDSNWETDNPEQVFAIYEEDNEGSRTLSGSIQVKLKALTIEPVGYEITVQTKDDIIRQLGWKRNSFFAFNQGGLSNGCGLLNGFTVYDCSSAVSYTMPSLKK
jgi:hypothetical protein